MSSRPPVVGSAVRRLVWRELTQNKVRTFSLFLLTLLPVMFAWAAAVSSDSGSTQPGADLEDFATSQWGQADGVFFGDGDPSELPGNPTIVSWRDFPTTVGQATIVVSDFPSGEPLVEGTSEQVRFTLANGALPSRDDEVAISARALRAFGNELSLGDAITWGDEQLVIVGMLEDDAPTAYFVPSGKLLFAPGSLNSGFLTTLVDWDGDPPAEISLAQIGPSREDFGVQLRSSFVVQNTPSSETSPALISAVFMIGISIATGTIAFVAWRTSAERRLRAIGLLSSSGATTSQVTATQALQAFIISVAAIAVGALLLIAVLLRWQIFFSGEGQPIAVPVAGVVAPAVIAVVVATLAAWWPGRQAARVPLASVLAGRMTEAPPQALSPFVGVLLVVIGFFALGRSTSGMTSETGLILWGAGGLIAIAIGALPILATLFRTGTHRAVGPALPVTGRLVARSLSRHAGRSAATVLGIGAIVAAVWTGAIDAQERIDGGFFDGNITRSDGQRSSAGTITGFSVDGSMRGFSGDEASPGVFVAIAHPDPAIRNEVVEEVLALSGGAGERFDLHAVSGEFGNSGLFLEDAVDPAILGSISAVVPQEQQVVLEVLGPDVSQERTPALDVTAIALPLDLEASVADTLIADDRLIVAGVGRDLGLDVSTSGGDRRAQLILVAIGVAVATLVIGLVAHAVSEEARRETSLVELLGTGRRFTRQFLSLQVLILAGSGVAGGLLIGTLIRFAVDIGFFLPAFVLAVLILLPFVLAGGTYVFGIGRSQAANY